MELSVTNMFIKNPQFLGIMKSSILKDFHDVKLRIDFYKILASENQLINMVEKSCSEDHVNPNALKLVSNELVYTKILNYNEAEYFRNYLNFICSRNIQEDKQKNQAWQITFQFPNSTDLNFFRINLSSEQVLRLFTQVNSFYSNYIMFSFIAKQHIAEAKEEPIKKVTEYVNNIEEKIPTETQKTSQTIPPVKERNEFDDIFELCLNSSIKSSLIHYTFNYFRYFTQDHCKILSNAKGQVQYTLPLLVPGNLNFDEVYFESLIQANGSISSNNVIFVIKKILNNLLLNFKKYQEQPLVIMMLNYLLFIYMLKYLNDNNKDSFRNLFRKLICDPNTQSKMIQSLISTSSFSDFANKIYFKIINIDPNEAMNDQIIEKINKLSEEYKHLIPVSQKDFANQVLMKSTEIEQNNIPQFFSISNKKVIDISKLIDQKKQKIQSSVLFDPEQTLEQENNNTLYDILNYESGSSGTRIISKAYQYLVNYIKNPSSLLLLKDVDVPKEVVNLFDVLSKKILNPSMISKDNILTLNYYNTLIENLPRPNEFKHITLLYIVFQIMIPYSFDIYSNNQFVDCLL